MKYVFLIIAGLCFSTPSWAATHKLGALVDDGRTGIEKAAPVVPTGTDNGKKYDCLNDTDCPDGKKCGSNGKCVDICTMGTPFCAQESKYCSEQPPHSYICVECMTVDHCKTAKNTEGGYRCYQNECMVCESGATDCGCPSGKVADGSGGCKTPPPAEETTNSSCSPYTASTGGHYWNGNGAHAIPSGTKCWDVYGANATITVPTATYSTVNIRMWQGATVNGSFTTKSLSAAYNTNQNAHTITFNNKVTVNGPIKWEKQVQLNFKGGIDGNYTCHYLTCKGNYGPCTDAGQVDCPWGGGSGTGGAPDPNWTKDQKTEHCRLICGDNASWGNQRFYYDRPGAKFGGKEEVCTRYPKSCGYGCTYGWDFVYGTSVNQPYTCQTAKQR